MTINDYEGKTFVAFVDISGFQKMMENGDADKALNCFYTAGYDFISNQHRNSRVEGIFVSDCGILFVNNNSTPQNEPQIDDLKSILEVIKKINKKLIYEDIMLTTSIAYGDFKYEDRKEFIGISKIALLGNAYLCAFLDSKNTPKIQPGQCRLVMDELPEKFIKDNRFYSQHIKMICKRDDDSKHYHYYWMVNSPSDIKRFEQQYTEKLSDKVKYESLRHILKKYSQEPNI